MAAGAGAWVRPYRTGYRVYHREQPGGPLSGTRVYPTLEAAEALAAELRSQIAANRRTVGGAIDDYIDDMRDRGRAEKTTTENNRNLRKLCADVIDSPLAVLTARRAEALYAALDGYSAGTLRLILATASAWGNWLSAPRRRWLRANPFAAVEPRGERPDHRGESLRIDEARAFRSTAVTMAQTGDTRPLMVLVVLSCSLRPSEVVQITARDVDDGGAVLWIAGARLKTANTRRRIDVADPDLRALLVAAAAGKAPDERLFACSRQLVTEWCHRISAEAKVPSTDARGLRRTFATLAARRGRSLDDLAYSMGHGADASAATAQRHYIEPGAKEAGAAGRVADMLRRDGE